MSEQGRIWQYVSYNRYGYVWEDDNFDALAVVEKMPSGKWHWVTVKDQCGFAASKEEAMAATGYAT